MKQALSPTVTAGATWTRLDEHFAQYKNSMDYRRLQRHTKRKITKGNIWWS